MLDWVKDKYSSMIDVMPNQISNVMLYRFIDEWYGVKYRMGGTTKKGVDCSAFVQHLYRYVFGYDILRTACLQFKESKKISKDDLKEGDLELIEDYIVPGEKQFFRTLRIKQRGFNR